MFLNGTQRRVCARVVKRRINEKRGKSLKGKGRWTQGNYDSYVLVKSNVQMVGHC